MSLSSFEDITNILYINLDHRVDRKVQIEHEFKQFDMKPERFKAIMMQQGAIGCSMSHLKCLQLAKERNWEHVLICEDDITFLDPQRFRSSLDGFLKAHNDWDVVFISGNNIPPYTPVDDNCIRVYSCQCAAGYIVKRHYYDKLIDNVKKGLTMLMRDPTNKPQYAIDRYWFSLQRVDKWYLIIPPTVVQRAGYSDIEMRLTDYHYLMTDIDKTQMMNKNAQIQNMQNMSGVLNTISTSAKLPSTNIFNHK